VTAIRVLLADDQDLVRAGLRLIIDRAPGLAVVGEASNGTDAVRLARETRADVVLMDIRMPGLDGLSATRRITAEDDMAGVKVLILTTFEVDQYVFEAVRSGASGFLGKGARPEVLVEGIRTVARGDALLSPAATRGLIARFLTLRDPEPPHQPPPEIAALTDREREVVALIGEGMSNAEIADQLSLSPLTVKTHANHAMTKVGARDRAQLVVMAYQTGLARSAARAKRVLPDGGWPSGGHGAMVGRGRITWQAGGVQAKRRGTGGGVSAPARVHPETVQRIERSMGALGTAAIAAMDERLPWFRKMSAENRSWLGLVAQAGIASFADWIKHPERARPAATEVFGTAPRELARAVSLQHAVEMVRVIIDVVETQVDTLAAPGAEAELREAVLVYAREIAFSAAQVYARSAEARGAWDARLEALVVDSLVRGESQESLNSWASALNWSSSPVSVIAGGIDGEEAEPIIEELRAQARRARLDLLAGVQGNRLIVVLGGTDDPMAVAERFAGRFGPGPVVVGPPARDLRSASASARAALAGLRVAPAWPDAPRPASADELLPERALDGDAEAINALVTEGYEPLLAGGPALLETLTTYLEQGSSLEATARMLFVHPNTVRYRLRRVTELTGYTPSVGREGFTLWTAIILGRLAARRGG
jgi:DNA-binding NarL/FixJ family response regulator/DNA-binding PucR family transcriptional regulator